VTYRVGWSLIHFVWQGLLIAVVLAVVLSVLRGRSATSRYWVAWVGLLAMAACLPLTAWLLPAPEHAVSSTQQLPADEEPVLNEVPVGAAAVAGMGSRGEGDVEPLPTPAVSTADSVAEPAELTADDGGSPGHVASCSPDWRLTQVVEPLLPGAVCCWLLGVTVLSVWRFGGWVWVQRLRRVGTSEAPEALRQSFAALAKCSGVRRTVRLVQSTLVEVPTVVGWLRPAVLVPVAVLAELPPHQLEMILAHELAHIRRYDYLLNLVQTAIETVLFYHPALWWLSRRIRTERENCCDDWAVAVTGDSVGYARVLTHLEERRHGQQHRAPAGVAISSEGVSLLSRVRRLLPAARDDHARPRTWLAGAIPLALLLSGATIAYMAAPEKELLHDRSADRRQILFFAPTTKWLPKPQIDIPDSRADDEASMRESGMSI